MNSEHGFDENTRYVPLRWVFISIGVSGSCVVAVCLSAFTVGGVLARNSLGQEALSQRVSNIETDRTVRIREGEAFQRESLQRLATIEAKLDQALKAQRH